MHAYLTHLAPEVDYQTFLAKCPEGVEPAYDGLQVLDWLVINIR